MSTLDDTADGNAGHNRVMAAASRPGRDRGCDGPRGPLVVCVPASLPTGAFSPDHLRFENGESDFQQIALEFSGIV